MGLEAEQKIFYRLREDTERFSATIASADADSIVLRTLTNRTPELSKGKYLVISDKEFDYYTEVVSIEGNNVKLKRMWAEGREYFRVDDVLAVSFRKINEDDFKKSKIISGFSPEPTEMVQPEESIQPGLWKLLVNINRKLGLILDKMNIESAGLAHTEERMVNLSAAGIRFTGRENFEQGQALEVKMLLPTYPQLGLIVYGRVVRVIDLGNGTYDVAVGFEDLPDEIKDEIVQYTLNRQREIIRKQRYGEEKNA